MPIITSTGPELDRDDAIHFDKTMRNAIAAIIATIREADHQSAERALAVCRLREARHWLGEDLAVLGGAIVDPSADVPRPNAEIWNEEMKR